MDQLADRIAETVRSLAREGAECARVARLASAGLDELGRRAAINRADYEQLPEIHASLAQCDRSQRVSWGPIKECLSRTGLTREKFAAAAGISMSTLSRVRAGEPVSDATAGAIKQLCNRLSNLSLSVS